MIIFIMIMNILIFKGCGLSVPDGARKSKGALKEKPLLAKRRLRGGILMGV